LSVYSFDNSGNMTTTTYAAYDANGAAITTAPTSAAQIASLKVSRTLTAATGTANQTGLLVQTGTTASQGTYDLTSLGTGGTAVSAANAADMLSAVNQALGAVTNYAASIGATQDRMTSASNFNSAVTTDYANGISALVDADMNTASTRLQALQTQQQLGIQSLSIANQNAQLILKLFREWGVSRAVARRAALRGAAQASQACAALFCVRGGGASFPGTYFWRAPISPEPSRGRLSYRKRRESGVYRLSGPR